MLHVVPVGCVASPGDDLERRLRQCSGAGGLLARVEIRVWDSSAEMRLVTRDSLIGTGPAKAIS